MDPPLSSDDFNHMCPDTAAFIIYKALWVRCWMLCVSQGGFTSGIPIGYLWQAATVEFFNILHYGGSKASKTNRRRGQKVAGASSPSLTDS